MQSLKIVYQISKIVADNIYCQFRAPLLKETHVRRYRVYRYSYVIRPLTAVDDKINLMLDVPRQ